VKILLADDHQMVRDGLKALLEREGLLVVAQAATGREAVALALQFRPDVAIMDISMPELNGIDATRRLVAEIPGIKVIALSMNSDRRYVVAMFAAGASGYLLKNSASDELIRAIVTVAGGQSFISPGIASLVVEGLVAGERPAGPTGSLLSPREREVLQLVAEGRSSKEIGVDLGIAVPTVETHRRQIMDKLELRSIAELTKYAIREGLTSVR
jgi:DNA-binding NarL/FixJ family response regulator